MELSLDEAFLPFVELISELSDLEGRVADVFDDGQVSMEIEKAEMGLPVELDILVDDSGQVTLGGVPPLYHLETSFTPVFHQLTLKLEVTNDYG